MQRYYITDRRECRDVLDCIERAASAGVNYIQIREKDLNARDLLLLARRAVAIARPWRARILLNGRIDIALAAGADGVHLSSGSIPVEAWRVVVPREFVIAVSCHSIRELQEARAADFATFGPVFFSPGKGPPVGLDALRTAVNASPIPVFALGGIEESNAQACVDAGAVGIAAIRMFQR